MVQVITDELEAVIALGADQSHLYKLSDTCADLQSHPICMYAPRSPASCSSGTPALHHASMLFKFILFHAMGVFSEGTLVHPGLSMPRACCSASYPNIMQLGCKLIACMHMVTVLAPMVRLLDSHVYALWP